MGHFNRLKPQIPAETGPWICRPAIKRVRTPQGGRPGPTAAQAALAARVTQTNTEMDQVVPRSQRVKRVWVTADAINGEFTE